MHGENVAVASKEAQVLHGEMKGNLLDGNSTNYDMDRGFTRHSIDDNNGQGILVKLGRQCIINFMRMLLWDKDARSVFIEVMIFLTFNYYLSVTLYEVFDCIIDSSWLSNPFSAQDVAFIRLCRRDICLKTLA